MNLLFVLIIFIIGCKVFRTTLFSQRAAVIVTPLLIALFFYTLWPLAEQSLKVPPVHGFEMTGRSLFYCLLDTFFVICILWLYNIYLVRKEKRNIKLDVSKHTEREKDSSNYFILTMFVIGYILFAISLRNFFSFHITYETNRMLSSESTFAFLPIAKTLLSLCCALYILKNLHSSIKKMKKIQLFFCLLAIIMPFMLASMTADKDPILYVCAALFFSFAKMSAKPNTALLAVTILVSMVVSLCGLYLFSWHRGGEQHVFARLEQQIRGEGLSITAVDPGGPYSFLSYEYNIGLPDVLQVPVLQRLHSIVPKKFTSFRPNGIGQVGFEWFTTISAIDGLGMGWHPMAEMRMYLWHSIGAGYIFLLLAIGSGFLWLFQLPGNYAFSESGKICVFSALIISHRGAVENTLKGLGVIYLILFVCLLISLIIKKLLVGSR